MLVLSRKQGEKLLIGDGITMVVSTIGRNRVVVGIEAPADVRVIRGELTSFEDAELTPLHCVSTTAGEHHNPPDKPR